MSQKLLKIFGTINFYNCKADVVRIGREKLKLSDELDRISKLKTEIDRDHQGAHDRIKFLNDNPVFCL